jgi:hypothetical protein
MIDIEIAISTAEDNAAKSQELSFLLQTLGNTMPFEMTQYVIAEIAKLSRMPELEKKILEFKQEPNPVEQKRQELELAKLEAEIERIKADAQQKLSSAGEDDLDKVLKYQKARVEEAKARGDISVKEAELVLRRALGEQEIIQRNIASAAQIASQMASAAIAGVSASANIQHGESRSDSTNASVSATWQSQEIDANNFSIQHIYTHEG